MSKEMFVKQNFINGMTAQEEIHKGKKKEIECKEKCLKEILLA